VLFVSGGSGFFRGGQGLGVWSVCLGRGKGVGLRGEGGVGLSKQEGAKAMTAVQSSTFPVQPPETPALNTPTHFFKASQLSASSKAPTSRCACRISAPNPPNDSGDWMPLASPICSTLQRCSCLGVWGVWGLEGLGAWGEGGVRGRRFLEQTPHDEAQPLTRPPAPLNQPLTDQTPAAAGWSCRWGRTQTAGA